MNADTLLELEHLFQRADSVVPLRDITAESSGTTIALRHDVDDNEGALDAAVRLAAWEIARGFRSTFFMLHTARYWDAPEFRAKLEQITALGHEIGIHANAIPVALETGADPGHVLEEALERLRAWGIHVVGVAPHGDGRCYGPDGNIRFVNDEIFEECQRPELGTLESRGLTFKPRPLAAFGLTYEAYRLPRGFYLSDSGNQWAPSIALATTAFVGGLDAPLQVLVHPDWYTRAL